MKHYATEIFFKSLPIWIIVLLVIQVVMSNQLVNHSRNVEELDNKRRTLAEENEMLTQQLASVTSLQSTEQLAKQYGLVKSSKIIFLESGSYTVALNTPK